MARWPREYYYVYAMDERGGEWKGKASMCTSDREFKIEGREDCFVRGYDRTGFFEVDTGKDAKSWTVQLTDQANPVDPVSQSFRWPAEPASAVCLRSTRRVPRRTP